MQVARATAPVAARNGSLQGRLLASHALFHVMLPVQHESTWAEMESVAASSASSVGARDRSAEPLGAGAMKAAPHQAGS